MAGIQPFLEIYVSKTARSLSLSLCRALHVSIDIIVCMYVSIYLFQLFYFVPIVLKVFPLWLQITPLVIDILFHLCDLENRRG